MVTFFATDPYSTTTRPAEADIKRAELLFQQKSRPIAVDIFGVGTFSESDLEVLRKFFNIGNTARNVFSEADWLAMVGCTPNEHLLL